MHWASAIWHSTTHSRAAPCPTCTARDQSIYCTPSAFRHRHQPNITMKRGVPRVGVDVMHFKKSQDTGVKVRHSCSGMQWSSFSFFFFLLLFLVSAFGRQDAMQEHTFTGRKVPSYPVQERIAMILGHQLGSWTGLCDKIWCTLLGHASLSSLSA